MAQSNSGIQTEWQAQKWTSTKLNELTQCNKIIINVWHLKGHAGNNKFSFYKLLNLWYKDWIQVILELNKDQIFFSNQELKDDVLF